MGAEGGSLWAFHNNSEASISNRDYRDVEGAIYVGHPPIRPFKVKIVNTDHPITRGVKDFVVTDEQHYVVYDKDPKHVLARSVNEDGLDYKDIAGRTSNTAEAVWAYDYGNGRVCFMAPGHLISVLWNPEYEKMQRNAAKWLLREAETDNRVLPVSLLPALPSARRRLPVARPHCERPLCAINTRIWKTRFAVRRSSPSEVID